MPLYDFRCSKGHEFERFKRLDSAADEVCSCGSVAEIVVLRAPGMLGCESATAREDERVYREHNCTHTEVQMGGALVKTPLPPSMGCTCGNCASHVRRASVTSVAEPGKER